MHTFIQTSVTQIWNPNNMFQFVILFKLIYILIFLKKFILRCPFKKAFTFITCDEYTNLVLHTYNYAQVFFLSNLSFPTHFIFSHEISNVIQSRYKHSHWNLIFKRVLVSI